jgi:hypothetical protein
VSVTCADVAKLQMEYLYDRPELLAEGLMFADAKTTREILKECKKRGIDIGKHVAALINQRVHFNDATEVQR